MVFIPSPITDPLHISRLSGKRARPDFAQCYCWWGIQIRWFIIFWRGCTSKWVRLRLAHSHRDGVLTANRPWWQLVGRLKGMPCILYKSLSYIILYNWYTRSRHKTLPYKIDALILVSMRKSEIARAWSIPSLALHQRSSHGQKPRS